MNDAAIGIIGIVVLLVLMFISMPLGGAMALVGVIGFAFVSGFEQGLSIFARTAFTTLSDYLLMVIPLFILMGMLASASELSHAAFYAANKWIGHLRGGLAMAAVAGCAGFGAVCGSAVATATTMCTAALPEMRRYRYSDQLSLGTIACGGLLGFMIPPSVPFVIYAFLTEESIGSLFIAGILPGLLIALLFMIAIYVTCRLNPSLATKMPKATWKERGVALYRLWAVLLLFFLVIGGIYTGVFTATEAGAVGAFVAMIIGIARKKLNWKILSDSFIQTLVLAGMIYVLIIGAQIFNNFIAITRIPFTLAKFVGELDLPPIAIMVSFLLMFIILGFFMDILAVMMLSIPIINPILVALGIDQIWFGVLVVLTVMIGNISPPVGIVVYAISGLVRDVPIFSIFRGVWPFFLSMLVATILIVIFPQIATWLPQLMKPG